MCLFYKSRIITHVKHMLWKHLAHYRCLITLAMQLYDIFWLTAPGYIYHE